MKGIKFGVWAAFTILVLVFFAALIGQNGESMNFTLFFYTSKDYPKWSVLIGCILLGALVASLFFVVELVILETQNIRLRRLTRKLERALGPGAPAAGTNGPSPTIKSLGTGPSILTGGGPLVDPSVDEDV